MYGTVADLKVKPGKTNDLIAWADRWEAERGSKLAGYVNTYTLVTDGDSGHVLVMAVFDSKASYQANAADPAMNDWYEQMRAMLTADPIWNDGEITAAR